MRNRLFIAEKRDLALSIVAGLALSGHTPNDRTGRYKSGFIEVGDDTVTWLQGHMLDSCKPDVFGFAFGDIDSLPVIIPSDSWKYELIKTEMGWNELQSDVIADLFEKHRVIVNAGDPAREGQYLVDLVIRHLGRDPYGNGIERLWFSDVQASTLAKAASSTKPNAEYRNLCMSAQYRAMVDYEYAMTFTNLMTELIKRAGGASRASIGRLRTTIQRIVSDRDQARQEFKPTDHFIPTVTFSNGREAATGKWAWGSAVATDSSGRLVNKAIPDALWQKIKGKNATVVVSEKTTSLEHPPLPHHISSATQSLAKKHTYPASKTLDLAKTLYLPDGLSSYPRGDSRYMPTAFRAEAIPVIMENLKLIPDFAQMVAGADTSLTSKCWNDSKIQDHYALVPTTKLTLSEWNRISEDQRNFLRETTRQLLMQFYPPATYAQIRMEIECDGERFVVTGRKLIQAGWRSLLGKMDASEDDEKDTSLALFAKGETLTVTDFSLGATRTTIPPRFNDASLMAILESPSPLMPTPELKKVFVDGVGIGRPGSRPDALTVLFSLNVLTRPKSGKALDIETTPFGFSMTCALPEGIKSVPLTAIWELKLDLIARGKIPPEDFKAEVEGQIKKITADLIARYGASGMPIAHMERREVMEGEGEPCPKCQTGKLKTIFFKDTKGKTNRVLVCDRPREECDFRRFDVEPLPGNGNPCPKCNKGKLATISFLSSGVQTRALVCTEPKDVCGFFSVPVTPLAGAGKVCPKCQNGTLTTISIPIKDKASGEVKGRERRLVCSRGREACGYMTSCDPLPDEMKPCPKCGVGHLRTFSFADPNRRGSIKRGISCSRPKAECDFVKFEEEKIKPLPGDGKACEKCQTGKMTTKMIPVTDKDNPGKKKNTIVLACSNCRTIEFQKSKRKPK